MQKVITMKYYLFILFSLLLVSCKKEDVTNKKLKGTWKVSHQYTFWSNGSVSNSPEQSTDPDYGTLIMDKNGKGTLELTQENYVFDHYDTTWHSSSSYSVSPIYVPEKVIYDLEHTFEGGIEKINFKKDTISFFYYLQWNWDKKEFDLVNRNGGSTFSESVLICTRL